MEAGSHLAASAACLALCCACLAGCNDASKPPVPVPAADQKTTARTFIEGVTGKTAVDQGLSARDKLRAVDTQRRKDMEALDR